MQRSATLAGPGIARVPASHRPTVASSTSSAAAVSRRFMPSAAMAARRSSADNDAALDQAHPVRAQLLANRLLGFFDAERVGQRAVGMEQRQAFGAVNAAANEAHRIGGEDRRGLRDRVVGALAHAVCVVPLAPHVKQDFAA